MDKALILNELEMLKVDEEKDIAYINKLNRNIDKVRYLRMVKHYTQKDTARIIGITERHVKRIERKIKCPLNVPKMSSIKK